MYNFHGHPWAKILNEKFDSSGTPAARIKILKGKMFGKKSKEEKYLNDFFKQINRDKKQAIIKSEFEMNRIRREKNNTKIN